LASGVYELDPDGRRCFRPAIPHIPRLEDVVDVLDPALAAVRELDRTLAAWNRPGVVGRLLAKLGAVHSSAAPGGDHDLHRPARRLDGLAAIEGRWRRAVASARADSMVHQLAPFALTRPIFTIADAIEAIGGTFASVNGAAARLVDAGILTIGRGARRDRLFHAPEVLDLFDRLE